MMRKAMLSSLAAAAVMCVSLPAGDMAAARDAAAKAVPGKRTLAYGADPLQHVDYWPGAGPKSPLIVFVHGGGWKRGDKDMVEGSPKLAHWHGQGYAVASANYRLVPDATVEQQAADVAEAVSFLRANAARLAFDAERIALVGHSAGAHLVALAGTDPRWFNGAGLNMDAVRGIVPIDGAAYDVPRQLELGGPLMGRTYRQAFGSDRQRQERLSPTMQAASPNSPAFLILHVQRKDGVAQSRALAEALRKGGTSVEIEGFEGTGFGGHAAINRKLGRSDYPATTVLDRWLEKVLD